MSTAISIVIPLFALAAVFGPAIAAIVFGSIDSFRGRFGAGRIVFGLVWLSGLFVVGAVFDGATGVFALIGLPLFFLVFALLAALPAGLLASGVEGCIRGRGGAGRIAAGAVWLAVGIFVLVRISVPPAYETPFICEAGLSENDLFGVWRFSGEHGCGPFSVFELKPPVDGTETNAPAGVFFRYNRLSFQQGEDRLPSWSWNDYGTKRDKDLHLMRHELYLDDTENRRNFFVGGTGGTNLWLWSFRNSECYSGEHPFDDPDKFDYWYKSEGNPATNAPATHADSADGAKEPAP